MGKSTIPTGPFSIAMLVITRGEKCLIAGSPSTEHLQRLSAVAGLSALWQLAAFGRLLQQLPKPGDNLEPWLVIRLVKSMNNNSEWQHMAMDQYLYIPFLGGWTSIYQLFWCELQGDRVLTHPHMTTNTTRSSIFWGQHGMKPKSTPDIEVKVTVPGPQGAGDFGQRSRRQPCSGPSKGKRSRKFWGE